MSSHYSVATNILRIAIKLVLIGIVILLPINTVLSADEEMMTPYTVLDPETGFFVPKSGQIKAHEKRDDELSLTLREQELAITSQDMPAVSSWFANKSLLMSVGIILILLGGIIFRFLRE